MEMLFGTNSGKFDGVQWSREVAQEGKQAADFVEKSCAQLFASEDVVN